MNFGDLHPFFVHFPIAFFILILIIEIMRLFTSRIHSIVSLTILFLGTTLAFLAVQSGESEKARTLIYLDELSSNQGHLLLDQTSEITEEINDHEQKGNLVMWSSIIIFSNRRIYHKNAYGTPRWQPPSKELTNGKS